MHLDVELLLHAYESGYFPMAESRDADELLWFNPDPRAIIDLSAPHVPKSLRKLVRRQPFEVRVNTAFAAVVTCCAQPRRDDGESWINDDIRVIYQQMHELGYAHSVECWGAGELVGGLYGVSRGGAFFGESMFSLQPNASKVAYVYLLEILVKAGYRLLDTQFVNDHLRQFHVMEIPRDDYIAQLEQALIARPNPSHRFSAVSLKVLTTSPSSFSVIAPSSAKES